MINYTNLNSPLLTLHSFLFLQHRKTAQVFQPEASFSHGFDGRLQRLAGFSRLDLKIEEENVDAEAGTGGAGDDARHIDAAGGEFFQHHAETARLRAVDLADDQRAPAFRFA